MELSDLDDVTTQYEARQLAINWQNWQSTQSMGEWEVIEWRHAFYVLAKRFNLIEEFKEIGII